MTTDELERLRRKHEKVLAPETRNLYICKVCRESVYSGLAWQSVAYPCSVVMLLDEMQAHIEERVARTLEDIIAQPVVGYSVGIKASEEPLITESPIKVYDATFNTGSQNYTETGIEMPVAATGNTNADNVRSSEPKCDHFEKFIGIMIPQSGEDGQVAESAKFVFCPKCGEKL